MKSAPEIAFDYRPSRLIAGALVLVAVLAIVAILASGLQAWVRAVLVAVAACFAAVSLWRFVHTRIARIAHGAGGWRLSDRHDGDIPVELHARARLGRLLVLDFTGAGRWFRCVIAPDVVDRDTWRRLLLVLAASGKARSDASA